MAHFIYELDEFQPWPGLAVYVYGEAVITYKWEGRDRDTGEPGGPYDIEVESIWINGDSVNDENTQLDYSGALYWAIEHRLSQSDHVIARAIADHEEG